MKVTEPKSRARSDHRSQLLREMPKQAVCAELGVWRGQFSERILKVTDPARLHLVDPWSFCPHYPHRLYGGKFAQNQADMDAIADEVTARLGSDPRVSIHRMSSAAFLKSCNVTPLDWVYIDGDHSTEAVLDDLRLAWRVTRPGGLIAGDDYFWTDADGTTSVKTAVLQFGRQQGAGFRLVGDQFIFIRH